MEPNFEMTSGQGPNSSVQREVEALLSLLEDENGAIRRASRDRLSTLGERVRPCLEGLCSHNDPRLRGRARGALKVLDGPVALQRLMRFAESPPLDLEEGSLLLAEIASPGLDHRPLVAQLDELAERLRGAVESAFPGQHRLRAFLRGLHEIEDFRGTRGDYASLSAALLPGLLGRRRGAPITMALLYALVGRRLGLDFEIIGLPAHAISRFREGRIECFIDAHADGVVWDRDKVFAFLASQGYQGGKAAASLKAMTVSACLARMALNAAHWADAAGLRQESALFEGAFHHLEIYALRDGKLDDPDHA